VPIEPTTESRRPGTSWRRAALAAALGLTLLAPAAGAAAQEASPAAAGTVAADGCWPAEQRLPQPDEAGARYTAAPAMVIDPARGYTATLETNKGTIEIELLPAEAPLAVNNFVCLAADGYYDGTPFHRIVAGFVVQGGDPTGTGTGGPGYAFADEPPARPYERGVVAMANAGPATNGSQFFIVLDDLSEQLPPNYTLFGRVVAGLDVVDAIAAVPTTAGPSGEESQPTEPVTLERVTVRESAPVPAATPVPAAEGSLGALSDRIAAAWAGVTSYRTTTTFTPPPGVDPAATPAAASAETIVDEVLLPDRRRVTRTAADGGFEAIVVEGRVFARGLLAQAAPNPPADPAAWVELDPTALDPANPVAGVVASLAGPVPPPLADLPPAARDLPATPLGPQTRGERTCDAYAVAVPGGDGGGGAELTVALGPDDLPCWLETRAGGAGSLVTYGAYNEPLTIEAPAVGTPAP